MNHQTTMAILEYLCNEGRNSFYAALGAIEAFRSGIADPQRSNLDGGRSRSDRLLRLLDDVREVMTTEPPAQDAAQWFDLSVCAGEVVEVLNLAARRRNRGIVFEAPEGDTALMQSRKEVEQVLGRMLDLAHRQTREHPVMARVRPGPAAGKLHFEVTLQDEELVAQLPGWLAADGEQVCIPTQKEVPAAIAVLVIAKRLRLMGGAVELVQEGEGWPVLRAVIPSRSSSCAEPEAEERSAPDHLNVLVAEDCDDSYALTALALRTERVWRAHDGEEALRMIRSQRFDLVLMDVHMPGMDGYTTIRGIRQWETETSNARTPVVVLSSDDLETQRRHAAQSGCSGYLRKPLKWNQLIDVLQQLKTGRSPVVGTPVQ